MSLVGQVIPGNLALASAQAKYAEFKEITNSTYLEIKEVTNGYVITATSSKSSKVLTRVCNSSEDLMEEIAKILVELKLTGKD